jgi:hypothetical protein
MDAQRYEAPVLVDLGTLAALTQATGFVNQEDGGSKLLIHHVGPSGPAGP